ncbi:MAG: tetratricopeptide repeat protein [Gammaproteobacteria bacterium]
MKKIPELDERYKKDFQSGIDQMKAGDWSSAIKTWRALAKALPKASGVRLNLAISLSEQGDLRAARTELDAGIAANKRNVELYNWAGMIARRQGEFTQAEQYYQTGIDQWAGYPPLFLNLGILYEVYLNEKEKALKQYRVYQALQAKPDSQVSKWIVDLERRVSTP